MKFIDEIEIKVRAGHGGAGCVSFLREKFRAFGGPDGGDGGRGGNLYISAHPSLQTLGHLLKARVYRAGNGEPGRGRKQTGANGEDAEVHVPIGTEVLDAHSGLLIADLNRPDARECVAEGGKGGQGNTHFASAVNQSPEYAQPGMPGEERILLLRLKLLADAGLVGLPNAGKSTLLSAVSHNHPRIADYAFTTLSPNIGVVESGDQMRRLLLADIPGIIEGAHQGHGLGLSFLRHIERVGLIVYVLDAASLNSRAELELLKEELGSYSPELLKRPALIVFNKIDLMGFDESFARELAEPLRDPQLWSDAPAVPDIIFLSARDGGEGIRDFIAKLFDYFPAATLAEVSLPGYIPPTQEEEHAPENP